MLHRRIHGDPREVARLTMLLMFGDVNTTSVVLKWEDEKKLHYLTSVISASITSGESKYATYQRFFYKGVNSRAAMS